MLAFPAFSTFFRNAKAKLGRVDSKGMEAFLAGLHASIRSAGRAVRWVSPPKKLGIAAHLGYCSDARANTQPVAHVPRQNSTALHPPTVAQTTTGNFQTRFLYPPRDSPRFDGVWDRSAVPLATLPVAGASVFEPCVLMHTGDGGSEADKVPKGDDTVALRGAPLPCALPLPCIPSLSPVPLLSQICSRWQGLRSG